MTGAELKAYCDEIVAFCKENDLRDHPTKYFEFRKVLMDVVSDESLDNAVRLDASVTQRSLSWLFNSVSGAQMKKRQPESSLYMSSNHECLTSKCRTGVTALATQFEFKLQPLVLGVKHYFGTGHKA